MRRKVTYSNVNLPSTIVYYKPRRNLIGFFLKSIKLLLMTLGLLLIGGILFLYFQGQQLAHSFNEEFLGFFGKFVEQVLTKDVASAMVIKTQLEKGVTIPQAIEAMKNHAEQWDIKLISSYPLHQKITALTGKPSLFVEIFEFCDVAVAASLLEHNPDFAAYLPCRIAVYEDKNGQIWFATLNMELLLHGTQGINPTTKVQALKNQEILLKIMGAGAHGVLGSSQE